MTLQRWIQAGECLALVVLIGCAYGFGVHTTQVAADRDKATAVGVQREADVAEYARQAEQTKGNAQASANNGEAMAQGHAKTEIQYRTITNTVTKYVATHPDVDACTLDGDGLRAWREANAGNAVAAGTGEHRSTSAD